MKATKQLRWMTAALLLWLATGSPVHAFYNPTTGRWLNRDRIEEVGGGNLYRAFANDSVTKIDVLGLELYLYDVTGWTLDDIHRNLGSQFLAVTEVHAPPTPIGGR